MGPAPRDLYDAAAHRFVTRGVSGRTPVALGADSAVVLVLAPAGARAARAGPVLRLDGRIVDYRCP